MQTDPRSLRTCARGASASVLHCKIFVVTPLSFSSAAAACRARRWGRPHPPSMAATMTRTYARGDSLHDYA